jgi:rhodanese-related sulfurtransferase
MDSSSKKTTTICPALFIEVGYNLSMSVMIMRIFILSLVLMSCKNNIEKTPHSANISPGVAHNLILQQGENQDFHIVDVRTLPEFNSGHIETAIHIDWQSNREALSSLNPNHTILLICQSGRRSALAMAHLKKKGFKYLYHLEGGIIAWVKTFNQFSVSPINE